MGKSKSSKRWLREHHNDQFVQMSRQDGYRSRASYKLIEIQQRDRVFKPGMLVVDLGAAPGGWCQVAAEHIGGRGRIVASDILPMDSLGDVDFVQGDFTEDTVFDEILLRLGSDRADLVMSDMAPNMSGVRDVDQPRAMYLAELAADFAARVLQPGGDFLVKVFQGEGFDEYLRQLRASFKKVQSRKPDASRGRSREVYLLARDFRGES